MSEHNPCQINYTFIRNFSIIVVFLILSAATVFICIQPSETNEIDPGTDTVEIEEPYYDFLEVSKDGAVRVAPEYLKLDEEFGLEKFSDEFILLVNETAKEAKITPEQYVLFAYHKSGKMGYIFKDNDELQKEIESMKRSFVAGDADSIYQKMKKDNPYMCLAVEWMLIPEVKKLSEYETITIPSIIDNIQVESVDYYGFYGVKGINNIILPASVKEIKSCAFENSDFAYITAKSETMPTFAKDALTNCRQLKKVLWNDSDILPLVYS